MRKEGNVEERTGLSEVGVWVNSFKFRFCFLCRGGGEGGWLIMVYTTFLLSYLLGRDGRQVAQLATQCTRRVLTVVTQLVYMDRLPL